MNPSDLNLLAVLPTSKAANLINRRPQTLRKWASKNTAPNGIQPIRINGRLAWRVADLEKLLGGNHD
jgi:hypothetical protein